MGGWGEEEGRQERTEEERWILDDSKHAEEKDNFIEREGRLMGGYRGGVCVCGGRRGGRSRQQRGRRREGIRTTCTHTVSQPVLLLTDDGL